MGKVVADSQMHILVHGNNNPDSGHSIHGVTDQEIVADAWTSAGGRVIRITLNDSPTHDPYLSEGYDEDGEWK